ncbi:MAG TPA: phosphopantothenoylcysteine decarboxylase [Verrucomicrobiae bacterium]
MHCIVTAGPTCEPLDRVRRLTNFSTGRLGVELANFLADAGHRVTLLLGEQATWAGEARAGRVERFSSTADLGERLQRLGYDDVGAVFHAAAVSDFRFGKVWLRAADGQLTEQQSGKFSTRQGTLLAELVPTPKLIAELRGWFPRTRLVGWKYEVEGDRAAAIRAAEQQLAACRTDACVANGPAYGAGFGLVGSAVRPTHLPSKAELFAALLRLVS